MLFGEIWAEVGAGRLGGVHGRFAPDPGRGHVPLRVFGVDQERAEAEVAAETEEVGVAERLGAGLDGLLDGAAVLQGKSTFTLRWGRQRTEEGTEVLSDRGTWTEVAAEAGAASAVSRRNLAVGVERHRDLHPSNRIELDQGMRWQRRTESLVGGADVVEPVAEAILGEGVDSLAKHTGFDGGQVEAFKENLGDLSTDAEEKSGSGTGDE